MLKQSFTNGVKLEAGIDEVGRGCLFGDVYCCAVIWPTELIEPPPVEIRDSKKLTRRQREQLRDYIQETAIDYSVASVDAQTIDEINILQATMKCMHKAVDGLQIQPELLLIDGNHFNIYRTGVNGDIIPHQTVIEGDSEYQSIACASILAKVARDEYIAELCERYPEFDEKYGLLSNMGYGTAKHLSGLSEYGLTPYHRRTFGICKELAARKNDSI